MTLLYFCLQTWVFLENSNSPKPKSTSSGIFLSLVDFLASHLAHLFLRHNPINKFNYAILQKMAAPKLNLSGLGKYLKLTIKLVISDSTEALNGEHYEMFDATILFPFIMKVKLPP